MKLVDKNNIEVKRGDKLTDFRGDVAWFRTSREPPHNGKAGFVYVVPRKKDIENNSVISREYYVTVFDLKWVE